MADDTARVREMPPDFRPEITEWLGEGRVGRVAETISASGERVAIGYLFPPDGCRTNAAFGDHLLRLAVWEVVEWDRVACQDESFKPDETSLWERCCLPWFSQRITEAVAVGCER